MARQSNDHQKFGADTDDYPNFNLANKKEICIFCLRTSAELVSDELHAVETKARVIGSTPQNFAEIMASGVRWSLQTRRCTPCSETWSSYMLYNHIYDCRVNDATYSPDLVSCRATQKWSSKGFEAAAVGNISKPECFAPGGQAASGQNWHAPSIARPRVASLPTNACRQPPSLLYSPFPGISSLDSHSLGQLQQGIGALPYNKDFTGYGSLGWSSAPSLQPTTAVSPAKNHFLDPEAATSGTPLMQPFQRCPDTNATAGHTVGSEANPRRHRRGPNFDSKLYKENRERGACDFHKRNHKVCNCK